MAFFLGTKLNTMVLLISLVFVTYLFGDVTASTKGTRNIGAHYPPLNRNLNLRARARHTRQQTTRRRQDLCSDAQVCVDELDATVPSLPIEVDEDNGIESVCGGFQDAFDMFALCTIDHCEDISCDVLAQELDTTIDFVNFFIAIFNDGASCNFEAIKCDDIPDPAPDPENNTTEYEYENKEYEYENKEYEYENKEYEYENKEYEYEYDYYEYEFNNSTDGTNTTEYEYEYEDEVEYEIHIDLPGKGNPPEGSLATKTSGGWMILSLVLASVVLMASNQLSDRF